MSRVYLDACSIIYVVEGVQPFQQAIKTKILQGQADPTSCVITSRLSRLECRILPLKNNDQQLLTVYEAFFSAARLVLAELTASVVERATDLRVKYGFKTPDSLHLATAIEESADVFLTGDGQLAKCVEVKVEVL